MLMAFSSPLLMNGRGVKRFHGIAEPERFTTAVYQAYVAGKPRLAGARAVLEQLGVAHWHLSMPNGSSDALKN
jgi:hypothetical protein